MLIPLLATLLLAAPPAQSRTCSGPLAHTTSLEHGKLKWFEGSYEAALARAAETKQILFMDFWTEW